MTEDVAASDYGPGDALGDVVRLAAGTCSTKSSAGAVNGAWASDPAEVAAGIPKAVVFIIIGRPEGIRLIVMPGDNFLRGMTVEDVLDVFFSEILFRLRDGSEEFQ